MSDLSLFEIINGYSKAKSREEGKKFISRSVSGSFVGKQNKRGLNVIVAFTQKLKSLIAYTSMRCYGLLLLGFGLVTLITHFSRIYMETDGAANIGVLIGGGISAVLGVIAVVFDKPLTVFLQDFPVTDFILYEFFCIKRSHKRTDEKGAPILLGLAIGIALGAVAALLPFLVVGAVMVGAVYVFLVFLSPEFSLFSTFLILPYLSLIDNNEIILSVFVLLNMLSFARKVLLGKRVLYIEQYDVCLFIFLLFVLISGIFIKGTESFTSSLVMIVLAGGYMLSGSIIANRRLADCLINAFIISSVPVSILAIYQFTVAIMKDGVTNYSGVSATFPSPSVLAAFLLLALVFSFYFIRAIHSIGAKILYGIICLITYAAMLFTYDLIAIVIGILIPIIYVTVRHLRVFGTGAILLSLVISLVIFIPSDVLMRLAELEAMKPLNIGEYAVRWELAKDMISTHLFTGIGIGEDSFIEELSTYGIHSFPNGASFFLEVATEAGIFALVALVFIILIRVRHTATYIPYIKTSHLNLTARFTNFALAAFLILGAFNYLWADMAIYFLFWCVFGVGSAALRIARQEHDDRVGYYSDGRSNDSSSVDINVKWKN